MPIAVYPEHDEALRIQQSGSDREVDLTLTGLTPGAVFVLERMAHEDTAIGLWEKLGRPANLTRAQEAALKAALPRREILTADSQGMLHLQLLLAPWELACLYQIA